MRKVFSADDVMDLFESKAACGELRVTHHRVSRMLGLTYTSSAVCRALDELVANGKLAMQQAYEGPKEYFLAGSTQRMATARQGMFAKPYVMPQPMRDVMARIQAERNAIESRML